MFEKYESNVRSYCRSFPKIFDSAKGCYLTDNENNSYLDFFAGAGALNYGHNEPRMKQSVLDYLNQDKVVHSLDFHTEAKLSFIVAFQKYILAPRKLDYKLQFPGPTGTNSVEAALKLARKVTGRNRIVAFTSAFHGMTLGAMSVSAKESAAGQVGGMEVTRFPFDGFADGASLDLLDKMIGHPGGIAKPAAFILETLQCEGGLNIASNQWLQKLAQIAKKHGILVIVDDVQVGCGRTGSFFSFERAGIVPDMVCMSKSISGMGLPMALVLLKPEHDVWKPGEHNGTFRGNNLAFVAAASALENYWKDQKFANYIGVMAHKMSELLEQLQQDFPRTIDSVRGMGMVQGICFRSPAMAAQVSKLAFEYGLIIESCGAQDEVLKLMPPLIISEQELEKGVDILRRALVHVEQIPVATKEKLFTELPA